MIKKILLGLGLLSGMVLIPHALYAGSTRIIEADQLRYGSALLSLPTATQTLVGTSETQTLTNKTLTSPSITTPTGITKSDVGLGNVDNTSDATKNSATATLTNKTLNGNTATNLINGSGTFNFNSSGTLTAPNATDTLVGKATTDTLTNKTLTSPVINSPTGLVKADVGLGNVDNTSDATKNAAAVQLTNKDIDGGTASNTSRLTIPKNTLANATALTRKEGTIIYATDQAKPYYDNGSALVAVGSGSGSGSAGYNTIQNTDAETDTSNWTESGGTFTRTNTAGELLLGAYSFKWTPSAAQNLRSAAVTIPDGLYGRNCYAQVIYKTASSDYTMQVLDGSNVVLASYAMPVASTAKIAPINFVCPTSGSIKLGFVTTASAVQLDFDSAFLGEATNITTSTNVTDWSAYTPTFTGFGTPSSVEFQYRRVGDSLHIKGKFTAGTTTATEARISFPNGLTAADTSKIPTIQIAGIAGTDETGTTYFGSYTLVEPSVSYFTFSKQASTQAATAKRNGNDFSTGRIITLQVTVPIQGWSAEPAFRPDLAAVNWSGQLSGGTKWTTASSSFVDVTSSGWSLTTTSSSNLTVTQYSTSPGITFTPPKIGRYEICFAGAIDNATSGSISAIKLTDGTTDIVGQIQASASGAGSLLPVSGCGSLNISVLSAVNIRAQIKAVSGTAEFGNGGSITFTVKSVDQSLPAPILLGSVTSNSTGAERVERVKLNCSASASISSQSGSWISSIGNISSSKCTVTIASGIFSAAPTCVGGIANLASTSILYNPIINVTSATSFTVAMMQQNGATTSADTNDDYQIICMGPR